MHQSSFGVLSITLGTWLPQPVQALWWQIPQIAVIHMVVVVELSVFCNKGNKWGGGGQRCLIYESPGVDGSDKMAHWSSDVDSAVRTSHIRSPEGESWGRGWKNRNSEPHPQTVLGRTRSGSCEALDLQEAQFNSMAKILLRPES